jgi:hypothetical protein
VNKLILLIVMAAFFLGACEPEVGSPAWCKKMEKTPKGDWTANEAADYLKYCVLEKEHE